jgi:hypothetical protein
MSQNLDQEKHGKLEAPVGDLLFRRWNSRVFAETPVDIDALKEIFSAGQWAASSYNEQPWRFVVGCLGDSVWLRVFESLTSANQSWTKSAFSQNGAANRVAQHDGGAASTQISFEATTQGLYVHEIARCFEPGFPKEFASIRGSSPEFAMSRQRRTALTRPRI